MHDSELHKRRQNARRDTIKKRLAQDHSPRAQAPSPAPAPNQARLHSIFRAAPIGIGLVIDRVLQEVNDRLCDMVGYTQEELVGQSARLLYPSDEDYAYVGQEKYQQIRDHGTGTVETHWRRKDGSIIDVLLSSTPLDLDDLSQGVTFTALDITDRRQAEDELQSIFDLSLDMVCIADINTSTFVKVNPAFERTLGYGQDELAGQSFLDLIHRDDRAATEAVVRSRLLKGESVINFENRYRCKDGTYRWLNWTSHPKPERGLTYAVARDTTERKNAEHALRESEAFLAETGLIARIGGWKHDLTTGKATWTQPLYDIIELETGPPPGAEEHLEYYPPEARRVLEEAYHRAVEAGEPFDLELEVTTAKGRPMWSRVIGRPVIVDGQCVEMRGTFQDITQRKQAEAEQRASESRYQAIVEDQTEFICRFTPDGKITFVNDALCRFAGQSRDDLIGNDFTAQLPAPQRQRLWNRLAALTPEYPTETHEDEVTLQNGEGFWGQWTNHAIFDESGRVVEYQAVGRDVTARKQAETALRRERDRAQKYLDTAGVMFVVLDRNGRVGLINKKGCEVLEYAEEEIIGRPWIDTFLLPEAHEEIAGVFDQLMCDNLKGAEYVENRVLTKGGKKRVIAWHNTILRDDAGEIVGTLSSGEDITERKQAEQALQASEEKYRAVFESESQGFFLMTDVFLDCNAQACHLWACSREDIIGHSPMDFSPATQPDGRDSEMAARGYVEAALAGIPQRFYWQHQRKDGTLIDCEIALDALQQGHRPILLAALTDITERRRAEAERARLTAIVEATSDLVSMATADRRITYMNRAGLNMLGLPEDKEQRIITVEGVHPDWAFHLVSEEGIPKAIQNGIWQGETAVRRTDGQEIPVSQVIMSHRSEDGDLEYLSTIMRDLTERKQVEQALQMFRFCLDHAPDAVFWMNRDGSFRYVNERACEALGYTEKELLNLSLWDIDPDMSKERMHQRWDRFKKDEVGTQQFETWHRRKNGNVFPVDVSTRHFWFEEGEFHVAFARDITERRAADMALRESETRFRELAEMLPQTVFEMDAAGRFTFANHAGLEAFGYSREELNEVPVAQFFAPEDRDRAIASVEKRLHNKVVANQEYHALRKDGTTFPILLYASPIVQDGRPVGLRGIGLDISERQKAEEERQARIHALESMEHINRIIREATDPEQMLWDVMETVRGIFGCDHAWLLYPCDPEASSFRIPVESIRSEYPGGHRQGPDLPMTADRAHVMREALAHEGPLWHTAGTDRPVESETATQFGVQSRLVTALYPKLGQPWMFGLHQCSHPRIWTDEDKWLFNEIGHRLGDGLSSLLSVRDLKESEARFRDLAELLPQTVFETNAEGRFTFVNRLACDSLGYHPEELSGLRMVDLFAERDRQQVVQGIEKSLRGEPSWDCECEAQRKDGTTFPALLYGAAILRDHVPVGVRGVVVDITERQYAERALQESKAKLESIFESSPNAIMVMDLEGNIVDCNRATMEMCGHLSKDALLGRSLLNLVADGNRTTAQMNLRVTLGQGLTRDVELTLLKQDGRAFPCEVSTSVMRDSGGQPMGLVASMNDITERKRAREALRKSEEKYRSLIANIPDVVWTSDQYGNTTFMSPNMEQVCGYRPEEICGHPDQPWFEKIHPDDLERVREAERRLFETGTPLDVEYRLRREDGTWIWLQDRSTGTYEKDGVRYADGVFVNITERRRLEQALERRLLALTRPLSETEGLEFEDLFDVAEIQSLQDLFAEATGVASLITRPDGTPITKPSHFCRLCATLIRQTPKGLTNCYHSDAVIGSHNPNGPTIQPCLSGGLWDAGASITAGGKHIANWLIGQVRDETQDEEKMADYAREIGVDPQTFLEAFREVPIMARDQFERIADALFAIADRLSTTAYQNVQQARFIGERRRAQEDLARERNLLRTLIDSLPDSTYIKDRDSRFLLCSRHTVRAAGLDSAEQVIGKTDFDFYAREVAEGFFQEEQLLMQSGEPLLNVERCVVDPVKKQPLWDLTTKVPLRDAEGKIVGLVGISRDITERKEAEEALAQSTHLLLESQKVAHLGHYSYDLGAGLWTSSDILDAIFGLPEGFPKTAAAWLQVVHPGQRVEMQTYLGEVVSGRRPGFDREYRIVRLSDRQVRWVHGLGRIERNEAGEATHMIGTIQDITERRQAEQALQESERRLSTLMANLPGMAYRCRTDAQWTMEFVSEGCRDLTGHASEDVVGNRCVSYDAIIHPDDRQYVHEQVNRSLRARQSFEIEYRIRTAQGQDKWVWERGRAVDTIVDERTTLEGFILDVSERIEAEQKLRAYQKKLKALASELSLAEERERRRMAAGLHDHACQNLVLSNMKLQGLRSALPAGPAQAIESVCHTLKETIAGIRDLTFDLSSPTLYKFGLSAALEELLKDKLRDEYDIHYQFTDDGKVKPLSQDVLVLLFQSVRELLINVIKHAQAHEVTLDIQRWKDSIQIVLVDDGIGFDVEEIVSIPSQHRSVGLFNIRERLDYIGGRLDMDSQPGRGSRFVLIAPLTTEVSQAKESHDGSENSTR